MQTVSLQPTAKIAVKRNVLKQYRVDNEDVVYLPKNTEFEIELFNPLQETILCKIKFNKRYTSGEGLVLRPGQRVFLERYLEEKVKFKFEIYEVDDTAASVYATANNGLISVEFFREVPAPYNYVTVSSTPIYRSNFQQDWITPTYTTSATSATGAIGTASYCSTGATLTATYACSTDNLVCGSGLSSKSLKSETGLVTKGSASSQSFNEVNLDFQSFPFHRVQVKLLPESKQILTVDDLKVRKYCSECGSKVKQGDKFCSNCGNKL